MLEPAAVNGIRDIINECWDQHGWTVPEPVRSMTVQILASKIDKNPWQPEPSYAARYLTIATTQAALDLANTCWFTRAVFPELGQRRGINASYYVQMGQGCYSQVLAQHPDRTIQIMRDHFEFLAEAAYTAIRHYGAFRSMWD